MRAQELYNLLARSEGEYEVNGLMITTVRKYLKGVALRDYYVSLGEKKIGFRWSRRWSAIDRKYRFSVRWIEDMKPTKADIVRLRLVL